LAQAILAQAFATVPRSLASCLVALSVAPMDPLWGNDPWDAARRVPPASPRREALLHARSGEPMSGGACDDPRLRAARALMFETVSAGAPRQTAAAVAAALWRLLAGTPSADHRVIEPMVGTSGDDLELKDRLAAVSDVLQAQLAASRAGLPAHSCQGLVDHATKVKRNVALHGFGDLGDRFSALSPAELRRLQRGQPRPPKVHASSPAPAPGSPLHGCVDAPAIGGLARPGPPALGQVCAVVGDWQVVASLVSGMGFGCPQPPVAPAPSAFGAAASATAPASQSEVSEECNEVEVGVESTEDELSAVLSPGDPNYSDLPRRLDPGASVATLAPCGQLHVVGLPLCDRGHELQQSSVPYLGRSCDRCGDHVEEGLMAWSCSECSFDLCEVCVQASSGNVPASSSLGPKVTSSLEESLG